MKQLIVKGMHCDACKKLIMMELEDVGLGQYVEHIDIADNVGTLRLSDNVSEEDVSQMKGIIEGMKGYTVV